MKTKLRSSRIFARPLVALACAAVAAACEAAPSEPDLEVQVEQLIIVPESAMIDPGDIVQFTAHGLTAANETLDVDVRWSATGGSIDDAGLFVSDSTVTEGAVTASLEGRGIQARASVRKRQVTELILTPGSATLVPGATQQFEARGVRNSGDTVPVNVSYSATGGSISSRGLYTAGQEAGNYEVIALYPRTELQDTAEVTVSEPSVEPVAEVTVTPTAASIEAGETVQLSATSKDADGNELPGRPVTWTTSDAGVATVSETGLVTGAAEGTATITASSESTSGTASVIVVAAAPPPPQGGTVRVQPTAETGPSHHSGDTADDVAIWVHPSDPTLSLVIGDDKDGGLMVWGLDGAELQYVEGTNYNNLDLRYNVPLAGRFSDGAEHQTVAILGVADELGQQIDFFKLNPAMRRVEPAGSIDLSVEPYGGCMYYSSVGRGFYFFVNDKTGLVQQWELADGGTGSITGTMVREFDVGTQPEGCVADDGLGHLYVGEEAVGVWKYGAEPGAGDARTQVDHTGSGGNLRADVEGMSIFYTDVGAGYLIVSSQGESRVALYTREGANAFLGKIEVEANGTIDAVSGTDGLDVVNFPLGGAFDAGLLAVHDATNQGDRASNIKFVSWSAVAQALALVTNSGHDPRSVGR